MAPLAVKSSSRSAPHLSLSLSSDADYPLLLVPASASLSPGFPPQGPVSPAYQPRSPSPVPSHALTTTPSDSEAMASRQQTRTALVPPGTSALAATPRTLNLAVPAHPIPSMQAAFAESLYEATHNSTIPTSAVAKPSLRDFDAKARHNMLIDQPAAAPPPGRLWRFRPGQLQHELWKLVAQISFGMHLLTQGMANNNAQVVQILQGHIDEVDEFLEVALEDLAQVSRDISQRIGFLRVPMENMSVFEQLLENRQFRSQIADGNEKIEHVLLRTRVLMHQLDEDIAHGVRATREFAAHLTRERDGQWSKLRPDVVPIYDAMRANADGWMNAFGELAAKITELDDLATRLAGIVTLMASKAGEISRRTWSTVPPFSVPPPPRPSSSSSESTVSAGSKMTRITGFPMPPAIQPPTLCHKQSRSSSAVFPHDEVKFFDGHPDKEPGDDEPAAALPRVPSEHRMGVGEHPPAAAELCGDAGKQRTGQEHEEDDGDEGDDDHHEEAEVMEAVAAKIPRLTLNMEMGLDLRMSLGFRMSDFGLENKLDLQALSDVPPIKDGKDTGSDSGDETWTEAEKEARDGGNNEIGIRGKVDAMVPDSRPDNPQESGGYAEDETRLEAESRLEAWRRGLSVGDDEAAEAQPLEQQHNMDEPPVDDDSRFGDNDDNIQIQIEADEPGNDIQTSIVEPPEELFILQPRTYTPRLPEPIPSPMVRTPVLPTAEPDSNARPSSPPPAPDFHRPPSQTPKRSSLRQRVSQRTKPPEAIHIPPPRISYQAPPDDPRPPPDTADSPACLSILPASTYRPESSAFRDSTQGRDSTYDYEASVPDSAAYVPDAGLRRSFSQSHIQRPVMPSPFSDRVLSRNDLISLPCTQLRPHSADANRRDGHESQQHRHQHQQQQQQQQQQGPSQTSRRFLQYPRQVSSRAGAVSLLSNATTMTYNPKASGMSMRGDVGVRSASATGTAAGGERKLKKKKSAFGWLKKAFTMDDEERAAFEARRQRQTDDFYGEARSPRYLDGRRVQ